MISEEIAVAARVLSMTDCDNISAVCRSSGVLELKTTDDDGREYTINVQNALRLLDDTRKAEAILTALREPSEAVVDAMESETPLTFKRHWLAHAIRVAVAAAEKEVGDA